MEPQTEIEQRILSELEEAWAESFVTIINTVILPTGNTSEVAEVCLACLSRNMARRRGSAVV